jgi:hypothetical protein
MPNHRKNLEHLVGTLYGVILINSVEMKKGRAHLRVVCTNCENEYEIPPHVLFDKRKEPNKGCKRCIPKNLQDYSNRMLSASDIQINIVYSNYKSKCKTKDWEFTLSKEEFKDIILSNCHYCNAVPNNIRLDRAKLRKGIGLSCLTNGIDRKDSEKGYIYGNVLPCCEDCNKAKRNLDYDQFINLIRDIYENLKLAT